MEKKLNTMERAFIQALYKEPMLKQKHVSRILAVAVGVYALALLALTLYLTFA